MPDLSSPHLSLLHAWATAQAQRDLPPSPDTLAALRRLLRGELPVDLAEEGGRTQ